MRNHQTRSTLPAPLGRREIRFVPDRFRQSSSPRRILRGVACALTLAALVGGCGSSDGGTTSPIGETGSARLTLAAVTPATVRLLVLEVNGPGIPTTIVANFPVDSANGVFSANGSVTVPAGSSRHLVLTARDAGGIITHRADTTMNLPAGDVALSLRLLPLDTRMQVSVQFATRGALVISRLASSAIVPGDTVAWQSTGSDADGRPITGQSLVWASSDPTALRSIGGGRFVAERTGGVVVQARSAALVAVDTTGITASASGGQWVSMTGLPGSGGFGGAWPSSSGKLYAIGPTFGTMTKFDGTSWTSLPSGTTNGLSGIWGLSDNAVYASGGNFAGSVSVLKFDGSSWGAIPGVPQTQYVTGIWGTADNDLFGSRIDGTVIHYDGNSWSVQSTGGARLEGIYGFARDRIYAVGNTGTIVRFDGSSWSAVSSGTSADLYTVWGNAASDIFVVGKTGMILHYDGVSWSTMSSGTNKLLASVRGRSSSDVMAVGDAGTIQHYDGVRWTTMASGTTADLIGVSAFGNGYIAVGMDHINNRPVALRYVP